MGKQHIESILLANWYFTRCKMECPISDKTELARKYLLTKVANAIDERNKTSRSFLRIANIMNSGNYYPFAYSNETETETKTEAITETENETDADFNSDVNPDNTNPTASNTSSNTSS